MELHAEWDASTSNRYLEEAPTTHEVTVYMTAAWRRGEERGPLRYSATSGRHYGTPNCQTFWEAVGELIRIMAWGSYKAA
jgi:hypothetical protein